MPICAKGVACVTSRVQRLTSQHTNACDNFKMASFVKEYKLTVLGSEAKLG